MSKIILPPKYMTGAEFKARLKPLVEGIKDEDFIFFGAGDLSVYRDKERGFSH